MNLWLDGKKRLSELDLGNNNFIISVPKELCPVYHRICSRLAWFN